MKKKIVIPDSFFVVLKKHFGTHTLAADSLGLDPRSYRQIRARGDAQPVIAKAIELLVEKVQRDEPNKAA